MNEEEPEREASGDEGHVNRLFLKEYQDLLTSDVKEDRKRSTEEADQARDTNTVSTSMRRRSGGRSSTRNRSSMW